MYLVDTNILLRFLLRNDPAYQSIRQAVRILKTRRERIVTTAQNMVEFWSVCTRPNTERGGLGLSVEATEGRLRLLERHFPILPEDTALYGEWKSLVSSYRVMGKQVHDARLVAAMTVHGLRRVLTSNVRDFSRYASITAFAPDDIT
jgi:predicted nucleic acid-binding protein